MSPLLDFHQYQTRRAFFKSTGLAAGRIALASLMFPGLFRATAQGLSRKTLKEYVGGVWLLGGAIIKEVSIYSEYKKDPAKKLMEAVEGGGCLPNGHEGMSQSELESFARMCGKFEEFLRNPL